MDPTLDPTDVAFAGVLGRLALLRDGRRARAQYEAATGFSSRRPVDHHRAPRATVRVNGG